MTKRVHVFHTRPAHKQFNDRVAVVELDTDDVDAALSLSFEKTNSIRAHWSENPEIVRYTHEGRARSTQVGDFMRVDGRCFEVSAFGFKEK